MFYHIDKSNLLKHEFVSNGGNELLLIGELNRNAFPQGFIVNSERIKKEGKFTEDLTEEIKIFFIKPSIEKGDSLISQLVVNRYIKNDVYIQRILREIIFEKVRLEKFIERPSRLSCIYLIEDKTLINTWYDKLGTSLASSTIYYLKPTQKKIISFENGIVIKESFHKGDAMFLEIGVKDLKLIESNAKNYWNGASTKNPLFEILFYGGLLNCK